MAKTSVVRFKRAKFHYSAFNEIRKSPGVRSNLRRAAQQIADAAGGEADGFVVEESDSRSRARFIVITAEPEAMVLEATERRLTNALGAGRG